MLLAMKPPLEYVLTRVEMPDALGTDTVFSQTASARQISTRRCCGRRGAGAARLRHGGTVLSNSRADSMPHDLALERIDDPTRLLQSQSLGLLHLKAFPKEECQLEPLVTSNRADGLDL